DVSGIELRRGPTCAAIELARNQNLTVRSEDTEVGRLLTGVVPSHGGTNNPVTRLECHGPFSLVKDGPVRPDCATEPAADLLRRPEVALVDQAPGRRSLRNHQRRRSAPGQLQFDRLDRERLWKRKPGPAPNEHVNDGLVWRSARSDVRRILLAEHVLFLVLD